MEAAAALEPAVPTLTVAAAADLMVGALLALMAVAAAALERRAVPAPTVVAARAYALPCVH